MVGGRGAAVALTVSIAVAVAASAAGCTASPGPVPVPDGGPTVERTTPSSVASSPTVLPELVLTMDLSEPRHEWEEVLTIPFGGGEGELGYEWDLNDQLRPDFPASFAVDADGSFWFLDVVKQRVARFDPDGRFLGAIPGLRRDRFHPRPSDLAVVDGEVHVLHDFRTRTFVSTPTAAGRWAESQLEDVEGRPLVASRMHAWDGELIVYLVGRAALEGTLRPDILGTGRDGWARIPEPDHARPEYLPGIPIGNDTWAAYGDFSDQDHEYRFRTGGRDVVQPVHFELVTSTGPAGRSLPAIVGTTIEVGLDGSVGMIVQASASSATGSGQGGRWYLQVGPEGRPLVFERLWPHPEVTDESQRRHLAAGPDGTVYQMVPLHVGMRISRYPGPAG